MHFKIVTVAFVIIFSSGYALNTYDLYSPPLHPRFFVLLKQNASPSFLTIQSCTTATGVLGSCVNFFGCYFSGGTPSGICSSGLKSCCEAITGTSKPFSTFRRTSTTSNPATFSIRRFSNSHCQVRLDFNIFNVGSTDSNGICSSGSLTVSGQLESNVPTICGYNTGQHMYLNFNTSTTITLNVMSLSATDVWSIQITQILCSDSKNLAPPGCLQYFSDQSGTVQSFNYRNDVDTFADGMDITYQLANMNYLVCIAPLNTPYTTITWSKPAGSSKYYFSVSYSVTLASDLLGDLAVASYEADCPDDYITIPNGQFTNYSGISTEATRFCGLGFPTHVISYSYTTGNSEEVRYLLQHRVVDAGLNGSKDLEDSLKKLLLATKSPRFALGVHFNSNELHTDDGNVGFFLNYVLS